MQHAIAGLDNGTADGLQGFKTIESILAYILDNPGRIEEFLKKLKKTWKKENNT